MCITNIKPHPTNPESIQAGSTIFSQKLVVEAREIHNWSTSLSSLYNSMWGLGHHILSWYLLIGVGHPWKVDIRVATLQHFTSLLLVLGGNLIQVVLFGDKNYHF